MKQQLEQRLKELRSEFESGQKAFAELEHRQVELESTLMRISGAIQVLEEELAKESEPDSENASQFEEIPEPVTE